MCVFKTEIWKSVIFRYRYIETHTISAEYYTHQVKYWKEHEYSSLVIDLSIDRFSNLN